jgi:hypothetical protein
MSRPSGAFRGRVKEGFQIECCRPCGTGASITPTLQFPASSLTQPHHRVTERRDDQLLRRDCGRDGIRRPPTPAPRPVSHVTGTRGPKRWPSDRKAVPPWVNASQTVLHVAGFLPRRGVLWRAPRTAVTHTSAHSTHKCTDGRRPAPTSGPEAGSTRRADASYDSQLFNGLLPQTYVQDRMSTPSFQWAIYLSRRGTRYPSLEQFIIQIPAQSKAVWVGNRP